jgi:predicted DNA-binding transcriptional regulator YafY
MTSYYAHSKPERSTPPEDGKKELILDILRYGAEVEVLSPKSLRIKAQEQLRRAAHLYEK